MRWLNQFSPMEVLPAVRFPKIFSPRVLIRDSNRVHEEDTKSSNTEPAANLKVSLHYWEDSLKDHEHSAFRRNDSKVPTLNVGTTDSWRNLEHRYLRDLPRWHWSFPDRVHDPCLSEADRQFVSALWENRGADSSPTVDDDPKGLHSDLFKAQGTRFKGKLKVFKCPYCVITCSNRGQLLGHIRIHTGERPFVCQEPGCKKAFIRNEELTRHRRIHTGERPYVCESCKKAFTRKDHLNKHVKIHVTSDDIFSG